MNPIYWFRITKNIPRINTNIDGHYILKIKNKFLVFTSKPIPGLICNKVSEKNIKGQNKAQYIAENVHDFDSNKHTVTQPQECVSYYNQNSKNLKPFEKLLQISDEN